MPADECLCEFDYTEPDGGESWHFTAVCQRCEYRWGTLHCHHEGRPSMTCPRCEIVQPRWLLQG